MGPSSAIAALVRGQRRVSSGCASPQCVHARIACRWVAPCATFFDPIVREHAARTSQLRPFRPDNCRTLQKRSPVLALSPLNKMSALLNLTVDRDDKKLDFRESNAVVELLGEGKRQ